MNETDYIEALEKHAEALRRALLKTVQTLEEFLINPDKHSVVLQARAVLDKQVG